jgi:hypothetical protein
MTVTINFEWVAIIIFLTLAIIFFYKWFRLRSLNTTLQKELALINAQYNNILNQQLRLDSTLDYIKTTKPLVDFLNYYINKHLIVKWTIEHKIQKGVMSINYISNKLLEESSINVFSTVKSTFSKNYFNLLTNIINEENMDEWLMGIIYSSLLELATKNNFILK